ncbi:MAG: hypothetical protein QMD95_00790 [Candidatus Hodarchaeaceae archaeon]|nr:hypothetical protein [Candidatus Hodarchaeaceae archaeon]
MTDEKRCPACGKPTAGYVPCPHCGADPEARTTIKFALYLCLIVLAFGAVFFAMHLSTIEPQPIAIASIDRWLDYSYVWLEGVVSSGPQYGSTSITFDIYDGSGGTIKESSTRVEIYDPAFKQLISENRVPRVGDNVKLFGQLRVYLDGSTEIRVSTSGDLHLTRAQQVETTIGELRTSWGTEQSLMFKRVSLEGTITDVKPLGSAKIYTLEDNGVDLQMYVHNGLEAYQKKSLNLNVLQRIRVNAGVSQYRGQPQLAIADNDEISVLGTLPALEVPLENINSTMRDNFVRVGGKIVFVELEGERGSLTITNRYIWLDNRYTPRIWLEEDVYKLLRDNEKKLLKRGSEIELVGRVRSYAAGVGGVRIEFLGPQTPSLQAGTYEPPLVENFAAITNDNQGDLVKVIGTITNLENVPKVALPSDRKFTLQDNYGGTIKIYVPNFLFERMINPPVVGSKVQIIGKVTMDSGALAIRPGVVDDVRVVS